MDQEEIRRFVTELPRARVQVASEEDGAPEVAWGDSFFFYGDESTMPFATILTGNYPGFDERSDLDRDGVFRLNVWVSPATAHAAAGEPPVDPDEFDYSVLDRVIPHPVYARQSWVSVLNPDSTDDQVRALLTEAHERAAERESRRGR